MEFAELILTPKLDNVVLHCPFQKPVDGTLCITGHHLILSSRKHGVEELWLLHRNVDLIERKPNGTTGGSLVIKCKDLRVIQLDINSADEFVKVATSIERLSSIDEPMLLYPFFYRPMYPVLEDGWTAFRPETEFSALIADGWRVSPVNREFRVCASYPAALVVPRTATDADVIAAAAFRDGGRFPVPAYRHPGTGGCLLRSGQPMTGPGSKRCKEDERLLNSVLGPGKRGYIVDTRAQGLAQAAKSRGGGFEVEMHYPQWRRVSKPIDRHHVLLESFARLVEACNDTGLSSDRWLSRLDSSGWMTHIKDTLNCACLVAQCLDQEGASVLVHGSEGLDATLLVTSLSQVILNPDCRTVRGLQALIEREWLQAGHPFPARHARGPYAPAAGRPRDAAPTFLLFLDCLHQVHHQFPASFEFNTHMLCLLFEHSYSSQFGTFLGQSEADRVFLKLPQRTVSLWSYLNRPELLETLISPIYEPNGRVLWPSVAPVSLTLWSELYLRWVVDPAPQKAAANRISALRDRDKELRLKVARLRTQLAALEREALAANVITTPVAVGEE